MDTGDHGAVLLHLRDPDAFWSRQSALARVLAWNPYKGRGTLVANAGRDLDVRGGELRELIRKRA